MTKVYILRVCRADMTSRNGFKWPDVGHEVVASNWIANDECGNGLHGWLHGVGDHGCVDYWRDADAKWLVIEADVSDIINLGNRIKFKKGVVRFVGAAREAAAFLESVDDVARASAVIGAARVVGDKQTVMVGALGTATVGRYGTATAGDCGTASAGVNGKASAGFEGALTIYYLYKQNKRRLATAHVGENGIKPDTFYRVDHAGKFIEVTND